MARVDLARQPLFAYLSWMVADFDAPPDEARPRAAAWRTLTAISMVIAGCDASVISVGAWLPEATAPVTTPDASANDAEPDTAIEPTEDSLDATQPDVLVGDEGSGLYLEAESGLLSGGYTIVDDPTASAGQFILPPGGANSDAQPGIARAVYDFEITTPGRYVIWGRIQTPDPLHNRSWIQVDGGTWYMWRITTGDIWYWFHVHDNNNFYTPLQFDLAAGHHQFTMAKAVDGARVDRFYITGSGDMPPQTNTACRPPNSIGADGGCSPSCGSLGGQTCGTTFCMGRTILQPVYDCPVCCL